MDDEKTENSLMPIFRDCANKASQLLDFFEPPVQRAAILSLLMAASAAEVSDRLGEDTVDTRRLIAEISTDLLTRLESLVENHKETGGFPLDGTDDSFWEEQCCE